MTGVQTCALPISDVVVSTPGRLIDHVRNTPCFNMDGVEVLVLDEADRMLEEVRRRAHCSACFR